MFFLFFQRGDGFYLHGDLKVLSLNHKYLLPILGILDSAFLLMYS